MYDELIEAMRLCVKYGKTQDALENAEQAADAIETLETNYDASTDIMKHQTEYIEELERERDSANEAATALYGALPKWIPVTERLPELNKEVLVYAVGKIDGFIGSSVFALSERFLFKFFPSSKGTEEWRSPWQYFMTDYEITHWMPLPQPPEEE